MSCNCDTDSNGTRVCPEHSITKPEYERVRQWKEFSALVEKHLNEYTVPQYGDYGEDAITDYTVKDCVKHVERYAKRYGSQSRDGQQELDFFKMAHYTQCAWDKYAYGVRVKEIEVEPGIPGRMVTCGTEEDVIIAESGKFVLDSIIHDKDGTVYHFWITKE